MSLKTLAVKFLVELDFEGRKAYQDESDIRSAASLAAEWKKNASQNHINQFFPVANVFNSLFGERRNRSGMELPPQGESKNARVFFNRVGSLISTGFLIAAPWTPIAQPVLFAHSAVRSTLATWNSLQEWAHRQVEKDPQSYVVNWS